MEKNQNVIIVAIVAVLLVFGGWYMLNQQNTEPQDPQDPQEPQVPETPAKSEIVIGAAMSLTGNMGASGARFKQGYEVWEEMVNDQGGILVEGERYPVSLIVYDDKSDPTTTASLYERLISVDNVDFIIGPFSSSCAMTMSPVAEEHGLVNIQPSSNAKAVYSQGWEWIIMGDIEGKADDLARPFFDFLDSLPEDQKPSTLATITLNHVYTEDIVSQFDDWCDEIGVEWIMNEEVPADIKDMTGVISKIQAAEPDVFMDVVFVNQGVLTARAMEELEYTPSFYYEQLAYNPDYHQNVGNMGNGALCMVDWTLNGDFFESTPVTKLEFINYYEEKYGHKPDSFPAKGFAGLQLLQLAVESVGTIDDIVEKDHVAIRDYLKDNEHLTIVGTYSFKDDGSCLPASRVGQLSLVDGEYSINAVYPDSAATSDLLYPYSPGE